jgi:hypothetical protein
MLSALATSVLYCPGCRDDRVFEQPDCVDGHDDCPDWACMECGFALVTGFAVAMASRPGGRPATCSSAA